MAEYTSDEHPTVPDMASPSGTDNDSDYAVTTTNDLAVTPPVDNKVVMPDPSNEFIPAAKANKQGVAVASKVNRHSYRHALPVADVIGLARRLGLIGPADQNTMNTVKNSEGTQTDDTHATTLVQID